MRAAPSPSTAADEIPTSSAHPPGRAVRRRRWLELRLGELVVAFAPCLGWPRSRSASPPQPPLYICNVLRSLCVGACVFTCECVSVWVGARARVAKGSIYRQCE